MYILNWTALSVYCGIAGRVSQKVSTNDQHHNDIFLFGLQFLFRFE